MRFSVLRTHLLKSRLNHADRAPYSCYHHGYYYSDDYFQCLIIIVIVIIDFISYILIFHPPHDCQAQVLLFFSNCDLKHWLQKKKKIQCICNVL